MIFQGQRRERSNKHIPVELLFTENMMRTAASVIPRRLRKINVIIMLIQIHTYIYIFFFFRYLPANRSNAEASRSSALLRFAGSDADQLD